MKSILVKTVYHDDHVETILGNPLELPGNYRSFQVRKIRNIPHDIGSHEVVPLVAVTCDISWLGGKPGRLEFDFHELGVGRIIR